MNVEERLIREKAIDQNIKRILYFVLIAMGVNLLHIAYFLFRIGMPETLEYKWQIGIIFSHSAIFLISFLMWVILLFHKRMGKPSKPRVNVFVHLYFLFIILLAVGIVVIDQLVTDSIIAYLIVCAIVALVILIEPKYSLLLFLFSYVLFFIGVGMVQQNPEILLSIQVNGLTAAGLGVFLSITLWKNARERISQGIIISNQASNLEHRNRELQDQSIKLETAIASRDRFLSIISHDLKSPFNSLLGFSDILLEDWQEMDDKEKIQIIRIIKETSEATYQLLLNLLDWARLQKEQMKVRRKSFHFRQLTDQVLSQLNAQATLKEVRFSLNIPDEFMAYADEDMLNSVLRNLISNAIKFSPKGSEITITTKDINGMLQCCVEDQGAGVSEEMGENIFKKSMSLSGTNHETGTGLGLQICKELIRMHKGNIWVESEAGKGARFCFNIPQS